MKIKSSKSRKVKHRGSESTKSLKMIQDEIFENHKKKKSRERERKKHNKQVEGGSAFKIAIVYMYYKTHLRKKKKEKTIMKLVSPRLSPHKKL